MPEGDVVPPDGLGLAEAIGVLRGRRQARPLRPGLARGVRAGRCIRIVPTGRPARPRGASGRSGALGAGERLAAACLARVTGQPYSDARALVESASLWERIGAQFERACTLRLLVRAPSGSG